MRFAHLAACFALGFLICATAASCNDSDSMSTPPPALSAPQPPPVTAMPKPLTFEVASDLPPVPGNLDNAAAPREMVRAAYEFAARHPEVLKYVPCFCGCERMGHSGNDDCFVSQRDSKGKPTEWETHGLICEICIDVANDALRMHNAGASVTSIRDAIEKKYAEGRSHTPTPHPPKSPSKAKTGGGTHDHQH